MKWALFSIIGLGAGVAITWITGAKHRAQKQAMATPAAPGGPPAVAGSGDSVPLAPGHPLSPGEVVSRADVRYTDPVPPEYMAQANAMLGKYGAVVVRLAHSHNRGGPCNPSDDYATAVIEWLIAYNDAAKPVGCEIAIPHQGQDTWSKTL